MGGGPWEHKNVNQHNYKQISHSGPTLSFFLFFFCLFSLKRIHVYSSKKWNMGKNKYSLIEVEQNYSRSSKTTNHDQNIWLSMFRGEKLFHSILNVNHSTMTIQPTCIAHATQHYLFFCLARETSSWQNEKSNWNHAQ